MLQAPVPPPPSSERLLVLTLIAGFVAALIVGAYALLNHSPIAHVSSHPLRFLEGEYPHRALYELSPTGSSTPVTLPVSGTLIEYARARGVEAVITESKPGVQDITVLGATPHALTTDGGIKSALAISSDGKTVAYAAYIAKTVATSTPTFYNFNSWVVKVADIATGKVMTEGAGSGPAFFVRDGKSYLLFTSSQGITAKDIATGATQLLSLKIPYNSLNPARVSPDGMYLALVSPWYSSYHIDSIEPFKVTPIGAWPAATYTLEFSADTVVAARHLPDGSQEFFTSDAAHPAQEHAIGTPTVFVYRLIP